jgi:hypothetical protein
MARVRFSTQSSWFVRTVNGEYLKDVTTYNDKKVVCISRTYVPREVHTLLRICFNLGKDSVPNSYEAMYFRRS